MRKILLVLCALFICFNGYAKDIEVIEGKAQMAKRDGLVYVVFNWDDALWDKKTPIKEQWGEHYSKYVTEGERAFLSTFNEKAKKLQTTTDLSEAKYSIAIQFVNFDYYYSVMSFVPGHKHKVWANVTITDNATGDVVCRIKVTELEGDRDFVKFDSFPKMMQMFAEKMAKLK